MSLQSLPGPRFVRQTNLRPNEYRKNFRQIDGDVISAVTSEEADAVTPLMSKIYLRLVHAPAEYWEREGVLYISAGEKDGRPVKASKVLYELLGVASATAHKALRWMHEEGIIGYFSGKNGAGIRIFLNRASRSIGVRSAAAIKKNLPFARGSNEENGGSADEPAFNDSFAVSEVLEKDLNPRAPKSGAKPIEMVKKDPDHRPTLTVSVAKDAGVRASTLQKTALRFEVPVDEIVSRLSQELEPALQVAARRAAAQEHERTREWLESRGLPKAARVAQREAFNVLRRHGLVDDAAARTRASVEVGRGQCELSQARQLSVAELRELAETCVAMLEVHGQSIDLTLAGLSAEAGGVLLAEDAPKVRELARALASDGGERENLAGYH